MALWPTQKDTTVPVTAPSGYTTIPVSAPPVDTEAVPLTQEALLESGAAPVQANPHEMMQQLQAQVAEQQKLIERLASERGVPVDPQQVFSLALLDHLKAQQNANPVHKDSYESVIELVQDAVDNSKDLTMERANYLREEIQELWDRHPQHELAYCADLAKALYRHLRDPEAKA